MIRVIDASVAAKWFLEEAGTPLAKDLLDRLDRAEVTFHSPDLILAEVGNILWKKVRSAQLGAGQAQIAAKALPRYFEQLHPSEKLIDRALQMALELDHPIYDCLYLACAERLEARVVTADERLYRALADSPHAQLAEHIRNFR